MLPFKRDPGLPCLDATCQPDSELHIHEIYTYEYIAGLWRVPRRVPCLELVEYRASVEG